MRIFLITLSILLTSIGSIMAKNLYNFSIQDIDGNTVKLDKFKGKPILLVNTASRCGFTKQYANLANLHREYFEKNLIIIGTPSNSFHQELSNNEDVKEFCLVNYQTKFIISEIIEVNGENAHPLYNWILSEYNKTPKWNFYKYLFNGEGKLVESWSSMVKPDSKKITRLIDKLI